MARRGTGARREAAAGVDRGLLVRRLHHTPPGGTSSSYLVELPAGIRHVRIRANVSRTLVAVALLSFAGLDRKSTRLNSSHVAISYAVFCLKQKTRTHGRR